MSCVHSGRDLSHSTRDQDWREEIQEKESWGLRLMKSAKSCQRKSGGSGFGVNAVNLCAKTRMHLARTRELEERMTRGWEAIEVMVKNSEWVVAVCSSCGGAWRDCVWLVDVGFDGDCEIEGEVKAGQGR